MSTELWCKIFQHRSKLEISSLSGWKWLKVLTVVGYRKPKICYSIRVQYSLLKQQNIGTKWWSCTNLDVTSAVQKLFQSFSICSSKVLALYFDFKLWHRVYHIKPIHLTWLMLVFWDMCHTVSSYFRNCLSKQHDALQRRVSTNMLFFKNF